MEGQDLETWGVNKDGGIAAEQGQMSGQVTSGGRGRVLHQGSQPAQGARDNAAGLPPGA